MTQRWETRLKRNVGDRCIADDETLLSVGDALLRQVFDQAQAKGIFENGHGIIGVQPNLSGNSGYGDGFVKMLAHEERHLVSPIIADCGWRKLGLA